MKILTRNDEERRIVMRESRNVSIRYQDPVSACNGVKDKSIDLEKRDDLGRFNTYFRQIILYNSTPKVNLVG